MAGGKSSRMGQNKAQLDYNGKPLLDHMIRVLEQYGLNDTDIYVSGDFENYRCIKDITPHEGPAKAIYNILLRLDGYDGILFIPVDMPKLQPEILQLLTRQEKGAYFKGSPLPCFIAAASSTSKITAKSVRKLLNNLNIPEISLPRKYEFCMDNINTQDDWNRMLLT